MILRFLHYLTIVVEYLLVLWVWLIFVVKVTHLGECPEYPDDAGAARVTNINAHVATKLWEELTDFIEHLT